MEIKNIFTNGLAKLTVKICKFFVKIIAYIATE